MKLVTAAEMRAIEGEAAAAGVSAAALMESAGRAVALAVLEHLGGARARRIVVLVGPGNNGGDGLVAARHLYDLGEDVTIFLLTPRPAGDPNLEALGSREIDVIEAGQPGSEALLDEALRRADAIVDAVLGTGRARPLEGVIAATFDRLRAAKAPLLAVDLPTGVDCDSGALDPHAVPAAATFALGFSKVGLHTLPGSEYAGRIEVLDIGLPPEAGARLPIELLTPAWVRDRLPARPASANKGSFGRVLIVAGSASFTGAATLAALGALRSGAGLVTVAAIDAVRAAVSAQAPEATYLPLPEEDGGLGLAAANEIVRELPRYRALLIGPGLGQSEGARAVVRAVLASPAAANARLVVDADALNALARLRSWHGELPPNVVLTPHPGELSRLTGESVEGLQAARISVARRCSADWRQTLVLKGAHTVIARPDGATLVSPFASAALATGGTGDVLAGAIAGYMAQEVAPFEAAGLAVYLHGAAAASLQAEYGESGLLASELAAALAKTAARVRRSGAV